jgi:metallo-beta-lactamase family protein
MLLDSAKIQVNDVRYVNKKRRKNNQALFEPLYGPEHAAAALRRLP